MSDNRPTGPFHMSVPLHVVIAGLSLGVFAKYMDQSSVLGLGDIGTCLGIWIALAAVTAALAPSRLSAAVRSSLLMGSMVLAYYAATYMYFRAIPPRDVAVWGVVAVTAVPIFAALVWPARRAGWQAIPAVALPVSLLVAEALSLRFHAELHMAAMVFDVAAAGLLLLALPSNRALRVKASLLVLPLVFLLSWLVPEGLGLAFGVLTRVVT